MMPNELSDKIVVNTGNSVMTKEIGEGNSSIKVAPGEGMVPSNILREVNFDVKSSPRHHPTGRFGLSYDRKIKISPKMYFNQRFLNKDERFSKDPCFIFMALYYLERDCLERQQNISGQRGKCKTQNGELVMELHDAFDIFRNLMISFDIF